MNNCFVNCFTTVRTQHSSRLTTSEVTKAPTKVIRSCSSLADSRCKILFYDCRFYQDLLLNKISGSAVARVKSLSRKFLLSPSFPRIAKQSFHCSRRELTKIHQKKKYFGIRVINSRELLWYLILFFAIFLVENFIRYFPVSWQSTMYYFRIGTNMISFSILTWPGVNLEFSIYWQKNCFFDSEQYVCELNCLPQSNATGVTV